MAIASSFLGSVIGAALNNPSLTEVPRKPEARDQIFRRGVWRIKVGPALQEEIQRRGSFYLISRELLGNKRLNRRCLRAGCGVERQGDNKLRTPRKSHDFERRIELISQGLHQAHP